MSTLPPTPWHTLHMDFCGPFQYLFVVIDAYSRFPEVDIVHSTSSSAIIPKLDWIFATHGIPTVIGRDNGPPLQAMRLASTWERMASNCNGLHHYGHRQTQRLRTSWSQWQKPYAQPILKTRSGQNTYTNFSLIIVQLPTQPQDLPQQNYFSTAKYITNFHKWHQNMRRNTPNWRRMIRRKSWKWNRKQTNTGRPNLHTLKWEK